MGVFVSYSSRDKDAVTRLTQDLQDAEEQVWLDQRLAGGDAWWRAILEQIRGCDVFIFALSQNSLDSKPCHAELQYAQALGLPILPVQVGHVDSMQLNPLATVQTVDYRTSTSTVGMRMLSALNRARAQRQPLPAELPPEPSVPFEYLIRLYTTISGTDYLSPPDQAALVAQLQFGLREDGDHDAARNDIVMLLTKLRDREDVTYRTRTDVDAILAGIDNPAEPDRQPVPATTVDSRSTDPATTVGEISPLLKNSPTTDTAEPRIETPSPNTTTTTTAEKTTVPPGTGKRQTETARVQEKPPPSGLRSTRVLVGMAATAVFLIFAAVRMIQKAMSLEAGWWYETHLVVPAGICIAIAAALVIRIVVALVRRNTASETVGVEENPQSPSGPPNNALLVGMPVTAVILVAFGFFTGVPILMTVGVGLIIASVVVLVVRLTRRKAASAPPRLPPER
jgi:TIR domain